MATDSSGPPSPIVISWPQGCSGTVSILTAPPGAPPTTDSPADDEHRARPSVRAVPHPGYPVASLAAAPPIPAMPLRGNRWCELLGFRICRIDQWRLSPRDAIEEALRDEPGAEPDQQRAAHALLEPAGAAYAFGLALGEPGHVELHWRPDESDDEQQRRLDSRGRLALTKTAQQWLGSAARNEVEVVVSVARSLLCLRPRGLFPPPGTAVLFADGGGR